MSQVWNEWWVWAVAGLVLAILEVVVPGWIFLGFAVGAGAVALLLAVGGPFAAAMSGSVALLLVVFAVLSVIAWLVMRRVFGLRGGGSVKLFDHDINEN
ncbi:NfeD family protein [Tropicimonas sp. IMCC6043]|uniref:NfeD family protein n=1 Tax=Tropicimonas sp. IMCC6043 TaxID=2510645 RepID=UPI00101C0FCD|nr:hypothetical protein [Tropicimonas sp. IMCC6043]RYH06397.1 hypothetical protein EU800_23970 [Tropicimonas sp. IMCC6043]